MTWNPQLLHLEVLALFAPLCSYEIYSERAIARQEKLRWHAIELYRARHLDWQRRNRPHVQAKGREYEAKQKLKPDFRARRNATARALSHRKNIVAWQEEDLRCLNCETPFRRKFQTGRPTKYCNRRCKGQHRYKVYGREWNARKAAAEQAKKAGKP
jgi:hypothetical protein